MKNEVENNNRILILANSDGGLYSFRKKLLEELVERGYEVFIACPKGKFYENILQMGCKIVETATDRRGTNPIKDLKLLSAYKKIIKSVKPFVVLTYTIKPNIYGGLACRKTKTPYLTNITGLGTSIENPGLLQKLVLWLYKKGLKKAECVFFQNQYNLDFLTSKKIVKSRTVLLAGSGVDLEQHPYIDYPESDEEVNFISAMRVMKDKGIMELLDSAKEIKKEYPFVKFTLIGGVDEEKYKEMLEEAGKEGYLEYLGFRKDVDALISASHAMIIPSYHEGMCNSLLEAAACGRPVLATTVPGCRETFDEGVSGFGFSARSAESLTQAIKKFLELSLEDKKQMGLNGRKKMEEEFDRKKVVQTYLEEIEKVRE